MQLVELMGRKRGMAALMLTVLTISEGAIKFYSQLGFKTDASSPGIEDWKDGKPPGYRILSKSINVRSRVTLVLQNRTAPRDWLPKAVPHTNVLVGCL